MFDGECENVELKCTNDLMSVIVDKFGEHVATTTLGSTHFKATVKIQISPRFYGWVFGFAGKISILGPQCVKEESLILSWLLHIKECQIVQTNWKPSAKWELNGAEQIDRLKALSDERFRELYQYDLYKGSSSVLQIISQAEIDVIGCTLIAMKQKYMLLTLPSMKRG